MRNGRVLIVVGIILLLVVVLGFVFITQFGQGDPGPQPTSSAFQDTSPDPAGDDPTPTNEAGLPTPTPVAVVQIVIAVQELPRGFRIPANAVAIREWPEQSVPFNAVLEIEDVVGKIARTDIYREQPILSNLLVDDFENLTNNLARVGSDAAAVLPETLVAVSIPIDRLTSVAYAVQDGDRVDVIVSMLFVDVDDEFQTLSPNAQIIVSQDPEDGSFEFSEVIPGRPGNSVFGEIVVVPSERQRPRLVTQRTVQDALVVHVGEFPQDGRFIGIPPTPTPIPDEEGEDEDEVDEEGEPVVTPIPPRPNILTLGVTPQDAVLITWALEARLPLTLALRSATDTSRVPTDPVTLDYFMSQYRITVPAKRDYSIEPAIRSIRQLDIESEFLTFSQGDSQVGTTGGDS